MTASGPGLVQKPRRAYAFLRALRTVQTDVRLNSGFLRNLHRSFPYSNDEYLEQTSEGATTLKLGLKFVPRPELPKADCSC